LEDLALHQIEAPKGTIIPLDQVEIISRESSVQSAVKMGGVVIGKHHEDIHKLHITTSLLGGYFGSRLMRNLREDKGYTYGIGASVAHLLESSFLMISTDVVKQHTRETVEEIKKEINLLRDQQVDEDELQVLKNYLSGKFLSGIDTAFNIAGKFKAVMLHELDYDYYNEFLATLKAITPAEVQLTAQKYYDTEKMNLVVVGGAL
ncbi:MAG: insulinase family protein, partial [Bacteroidota bacterium]